MNLVIHIWSIGMFITIALTIRRNLVILCIDMFETVIFHFFRYSFMGDEGHDILQTTKQAMMKW